MRIPHGRLSRRLLLLAGGRRTSPRLSPQHLSPLRGPREVLFHQWSMRSSGAPRSASVTRRPSVAGELERNDRQPAREPKSATASPAERGPPAPEPEEQRQQGLADARVEARQALLHEQVARPSDDGPRDAYALARAARAFRVARSRGPQAPPAARAPRERAPSPRPAGHRTAGVPQRGERVEQGHALEDHPELRAQGPRRQRLPFTSTPPAAAGARSQVVSPVAGAVEKSPIALCRKARTVRARLGFREAGGNDH